MPEGDMVKQSTFSFLNSSKGSLDLFRYSTTIPIAKYGEIEDKIKDNARYHAANVDLWSEYSHIKEKTAIYGFLYKGQKTHSKNVFAKWVATRPDVKKYIGFIDRCNQKANDWNEKTILNPLLYQEISKELAAAKDPFLQQRYAYQKMRLLDCRIPNACKERGEVFKKYIENGQKNAIYWWSLFSFKQVRDAGEDCYIKAQVFANDDVKKMFALNEFQVKYALKAFAYCKNDTEKANILALIAIKNHGRNLPNLKMLVPLAPQNETVKLARRCDRLRCESFKEFHSCTLAYIKGCVGTKRFAVW